MMAGSSVLTKASSVEPFTGSARMAKARKSSFPVRAKLYIGMRQYVGEFSLTTNKFRFLIPSAKFLNKLPKEAEDGIRKQYGG
jgi:hypothetical protein